jgi:60 kDa SS-A/Ro ribonucleoprotein
MSMRNLRQHFSTRATPQSQPIPGREADMTANSAGGVSFKADKWTRLARFLVLGSEGGSYYASEQKLTADNAKSALDCIGEDGPRVVKLVTEVSDGGRAPKNTPAIFILAMAAKLGDQATREAAYKAVPKVCRIGTHLFQFCEAIKAFGGFSSGTQRALARWYDRMNHDALEDVRLNAELSDEDRGAAMDRIRRAGFNSTALQVVKYQSREGWSHRDVLRLAKPKGHERGGELDRILGWATDKWSPDLDAEPVLDGTELIWAFEKAKAVGLAADGKVSKASTKDIVRLITDFRLPREGIPTQYLNEIAVWEALLDNGGRGMPMTAMIRNLGKMSAIGLLKPMSKASGQVVQALGSAEAIRKARVHPLQMLVALKTYQSGKGFRGSLTWSPVSQIVDALDKGFYTAFGNVESTGLRWQLALDVSGSMQWSAIARMPGITPAVGAGAMAMVTAASEPQHVITAFSHKMVPVKGISPRMRLDNVVRQLASIPMGGTDCSLPMLWAMQNKIDVDVFVVYTDSETWAGRIHPKQALDQYRQKTGIPARLIVVGMLSNGFTIADPKDPGMLDVVGFDTATPNIMAGFAKGQF